MRGSLRRWRRSVRRWRRWGCASWLREWSFLPNRSAALAVFLAKPLKNLVSPPGFELGTSPRSAMPENLDVRAVSEARRIFARAVMATWMSVSSGPPPGSTSSRSDALRRLPRFRVFDFDGDVSGW
jgi:hypothetical protein